MHYEVNATVEQLEACFADLFEFAHTFAYEELHEELHEHLSEDLYAAEAAMIERFRRDFVIYQGSEVVRWFPAEIVDAQFTLRLTIKGVSYERVRRGAPTDLFGVREAPCHDCSVVPGQLHAYGCDSERCPRCSGQLLSCDCDWERDYVDEIDSFIGPVESSGSNRPRATTTPARVDGDDAPDQASGSGTASTHS